MQTRVSRTPTRPAMLAALAAAMAIAAGACSAPPASQAPVIAVPGSTIETRTVAAFTSVSVSGSLKVILATGIAPSVQVVAPANILPLITTATSGTELVVGVSAPGFVATAMPSVRIISADVTSVDLSEGAVATLETAAQRLAVSLGDGTTLRGIGTVGQLTVAVVGDSSAELGDLAADTASISMAAGARATLRVDRQLTGTADGGSVVTLVARPVAQAVTLSGGATIVGP